MFEMESGPAPKGREGRQATDLSPMLAAADAANGEWRSAVGTSSMHTYRTRIQSGTLEDAPVGKYEVKVQEETPAVGEVGEDDYESPTYRLFIRVADAETSAKLIEKAAARAERAAASDDDAPAEEVNTAPVNPLA